MCIYMINRENIELFSNLKDSYRHCCKTILELKKSKKFYIGATENPDERLGDHEEGKGMHKMYLLCYVKNGNKARKLEQKVIGRFLGKKNCKNESKGGEGLNDGPNFIYVLFK